MGMFDDVNYVMDCPKCKHLIKGFQSKSGPKVLAVLEFWEVDNFYSSCDNPACGIWIEFTLKKKCNKKRTIKDYRMNIVGGRALAKTSRRK